MFSCVPAAQRFLVVPNENFDIFWGFRLLELSSPHHTWYVTLPLIEQYTKSCRTYWAEGKFFVKQLGGGGGCFEILNITI